MRSRSSRQGEHHDVDGDWRGHAAPRASVFHHAGHRGQGAGRPCARGGGRHRREVAGARARSLDHLLQRSRRAVLPPCGAALHGPCRRRGERGVRGPQIPLEGAERDQLRARPPALPAELRPGLHQHRQDRLCDRHSADPSRPHRPGAADLRQRLSAAAAHHGALLRLRPGGGAHRHRHGSQDRHPVERRHVAFPRHRPLFKSRARLGPARARQAGDRKPQVADRL